MAYTKRTTFTIPGSMSSPEKAMLATDYAGRALNFMLQEGYITESEFHALDKRLAPLRRRFFELSERGPAHPKITSYDQLRGRR